MNLGLKSPLARNWRKTITSLESQIGRLELELCDRSCDHPNAIEDEDGKVVRDEDYSALYEPGVVIDNPNRPTAVFLTIADMLARATGEFDKALCLNGVGTDGVISEWTGLAGIPMATNPDTVLMMDDGLGYVVRAQSGGGGSVDRMTFDQATPSAVWIISHNRGKRPYVIVDVSSGNRVASRVDDPDVNTTIVTHAHPTSGRVELLF